MITLIDGVMGAGKSYYAVDYIYHKHSNYYQVYTNIDGFKYYDNIKYFKFSWLYDILNQLKIIYDDEASSDQDLWNYLYEIGFLNSNKKSDIKPVLFVIDEAHNFFNKKDDLLVWFITYHRHMFIDALLITQSYNLLYTTYHKLFENIIHAIPASKMLIANKFKYQKHIKLPISDGKFGTHAGDIYLKKDKKVFELYQSGDKVRAKSLLSKYLYYFVGFFVFAVLSFIYLKKAYFTPKKANDVSKQYIETNSTTNPKRYTLSGGFGDKFYITLKCIDKTCINTKKHIYLNIDDLQKIIVYSDSRFLSSTKINDNYVYIYLLVTSDFLSYFEGRKNEKSFTILN